MTPRLTTAVRGLLAASRPVHPDTAAAIASRRATLPAAVKTPAQLLGRRSTGCEGTHGVFPRCNLACTPCYHAKEAQQVRTDGPHTLAEVDRQMAHLRRVRGPGQHAQLIGGEVTLLGPEFHARALETMEAHDRKPMSMSHGDFDEDYLRALALRPDGTPRFRVLRIAAHFDALMLGRRGAERPATEADLHEHRRRFVAMFECLRAESGARSDLAHTMTVTPRNLAGVADVAATAAGLGFGMLSFQPAARVGNPRRWREDFRAITIDAVWDELERGLGARLPWAHLQMGDQRCNRSSYGLWAGGRFTALLDDRDPRDLRVRDAFLDAFGPMDFDRPALPLALAISRVLARRPAAVPLFAGWAVRLARRAGLRRLLTGRPRPLTVVVHAFIDADVVRPAWAAMQRGETASDPAVAAAQERLRACSYAMAHPDDDLLVPACVQHAVLDPQENLALRALLPARS